MNSRIALVAGLVSLIATAAGCARGPVGPSPRPVLAYELNAGRAPAAQPVDHSDRFESGTVTPRPVDPARMDKPFASLSSR